MTRFNRFAALFARIGLSIEDADRLAGVAMAGKSGCTRDEFTALLRHAIRDYAATGKDLYIHSAGEDVVIFTDEGYTVLNVLIGHVECLFRYKRHESFAKATRIYRTESFRPSKKLADLDTVAA